MKKCPYCAEEIQDEAIKCRYCYSDLTASRDEALRQRPEASSPATAAAASTSAPGTPSPQPTSQPATASAPESATPSAPPAAAPAATPGGDASPTPEPSSGEPAAPAAAMSGDASVRYSHSGYRYVLGYGADHFGIWDRQSPSEPAERFPRTDEGWRNAWLRFVTLEPKHVEVPQGATAAPSASPAAPEDGEETDAAKYTHTGTRYLLGYGESFFGIWDRQNPAAPVERFPRTDDGWAQAWHRYTQIESNFTEVAKD